MSLAYSYLLNEEQSDRTDSKEVKGVLSFTEEELLFEFKVYDLEGTAVSSLNKFSIGLDMISGVKFLKGFFSSELILESGRPPFFEPLPGSRNGIIKLKINRGHKEEAGDFAEQLKRHLSKKEDE